MHIYACAFNNLIINVLCCASGLLVCMHICACVRVFAFECDNGAMPMMTPIVIVI